MGTTQTRFGYLLLAIGIIATLAFGEEFCGNTFTIRVTVRFYERSVTSASSYSKTIESSSYFKKEYDSFSFEMQRSGGFKGFSASANIAFEKVSEDVTQTEEYRETVSQESTNYSVNFLQVIREETTELEIDGVTSRTVEEIFVDSVPIDDDYSSSRLTALAEEYIWYYYNQTDSVGEITGSTYTETVCMGKYEIDTE